MRSLYNPKKRYVQVCARFAVDMYVIPLLEVTMQSFGSVRVCSEMKRVVDNSTSEVLVSLPGGLLTSV